MIDPRELRIGNLAIGDGDDLGRVCVIGLNEIEYAHLFNPIPLSKEWLVKLDWEESEEEKGMFHHKKYRGWIIDTDGEGNFFYTAGMGKKVVLKTVHKLQNVFREIEGEELTINEKA